MHLARSLRSVFMDLTGERDHAQASGLGPDEVLAAGGHPDLTGGLVAEAVVSYADTAPFEVAEHLAPYVRANSAVPRSDVQVEPEPPGAAGEPHWYTLLTTAPPVTGAGSGPDELDVATSAFPGEGGAAAIAPSGEIDADLDFGHGGPAEHPAWGDDPTGDALPAGDALPVGPASPQPAFDPAVGDAGSDIDLRPLSGEQPAAPEGDGPDYLDGV